MRYKATKATAAQNMDRRAQRLLAGFEDRRRADKVAAGSGSPSRRRAGARR